MPGHWKGDLLMGRRQTAIGTHGGPLVALRDAVPICLTATPPEAVRSRPSGHCSRRLPDHLWKSLTWDQGKEMAQHVQFTVNTEGVPGLDKSVTLQMHRGSAAATKTANGLLRQWTSRKAPDMAALTATRPRS